MNNTRDEDVNGANGAAHEAPAPQHQEEDAVQPGEDPPVNPDIEEQAPDTNGVDHQNRHRLAEYLVWPSDGSNDDAVTRTQELIQTVTGQDQVFSYRTTQGRLVHWVVTLTENQADTIREHEDVENVEEVMNSAVVDEA